MLKNILAARSEPLKDAFFWLNGFRAFLLLLLFMTVVMAQVFEGPSGNLVRQPGFYLVLCFGFLYNLVDSLWLDRFKKYKLPIIFHLLIDTGFVFLWNVMHGGDWSLLLLYIFLILVAALLFGAMGAVFSGAFTLVWFSLLAYLFPELRDKNTWILSSAMIFGVAVLGTVLNFRITDLLNTLRIKEKALVQLMRLQEAILGQMPTALLFIEHKKTIGFANKVAIDALRKGGNLKGQQLAQISSPFYQFFESGLEFAKAAPYQQIQNIHQDQVSLVGTDTPRIFDAELSLIRSEENSITGYLLLFHDVTEKLKLEKALKQKDKLAAVGQLAAGIAHEIRNPLTSISGSIELLGRELKDSLGTDHKKLIEIGLKETKRLNDLITEFLDYVRPAPKNLERVQLGKLIDEVVSAVRNGQPHLAHEQIIVQAQDLEVRGIENRLAQVLWNLITNSIQAISLSGKIEVGCKRQDDGKILLWVEDNGPGIEFGIQDRIFEPFFTTKAKGTGLGLAMVYKIIEMHEAELNLDSVLGRGTRFEIKFPSHHDDHDL